MGGWYDQLKKSENGLGQNRQNRQNPPGYSFVGSVSTHRQWIEEISASSSPAGGGLITGQMYQDRWPTEKPEKAPGQNCQNRQNRTRVGFEGFVGSSPERIANFSRVAGWDAEDWQAAFDERAAILEYDAGLPRAEAERIARVEVFKMGGGAP